MTVLPEKFVIRCRKCSRRYRVDRRILETGVKCRDPECGLTLTQHNVVMESVVRRAPREHVDENGDRAAQHAPASDDAPPAPSPGTGPKGLNVLHAASIAATAILVLAAWVVTLLYMRTALGTVRVDAAEAAREEVQAEFEVLIEARLPALIDERLDQVTRGALDRMEEAIGEIEETARGAIEQLDRGTRQAVEDYVQTEVARMLAEAEGRVRDEVSAMAAASSMPVNGDEDENAAADDDGDSRASPQKVEESPAREERIDIIGTWIQSIQRGQRGARTMFVRRGGRAALRVDLSGLEAQVVGSERIVAQLRWTLSDNVVSIELRRVDPKSVFSMVQKEVEGVFRVNKSSKDTMELVNTRTGETFRWKRK